MKPLSVVMGGPGFVIVALPGYVHILFFGRYTKKCYLYSFLNPFIPKVLSEIRHIHCCKLEGCPAENKTVIKPLSGAVPLGSTVW